MSLKNPSPAAVRRGSALALTVRLQLILADELRLCDVADAEDTLAVLGEYFAAERARLSGERTPLLNLRLPA